MPDATIDGRPHASGESSASSKRASGYAVFYPLGQKIGRAEEVFVNWDGEPGHIRIRLGFFGMKSVLIPVQFVEADEKKKTLVLKQESLASYADIRTGPISGPPKQAG